MRGDELMQPEANVPRSYKSKMFKSPLEKPKLGAILSKEPQFHNSPEKVRLVKLNLE